MTDPIPQDQLPTGSLFSRLFRGRVGWMLARNTIVSTGVFAVGLAVLWVLVEHAEMGELPATAASFIAANSLHYVFGRLWVFRGTQRAVASGFALFLMNGLIGLGLTIGMMAMLREHTAINLYVARILISVIAGLLMFVLNAVWNFRRV